MAQPQANFKRFVLFVAHNLNPSSEEAAAVRMVQNGALKSHVSIIGVSPENLPSLPQQVKQQGTPILLDAIAGTFSKNVITVLQSMARRLLASVAPPDPSQVARAPTVGGYGAVTHQQQHARVPMPNRQPSTLYQPPKLDLGEGFLKAEGTEAASVLETRSAIGGQGIAGSSSFGSKIGMRFDEGKFEMATVPIAEDFGRRYLHDAFGIQGENTGAAATSDMLPSTTSSVARVGNETEAKVSGIESDAVKSLIAERTKHEERIKMIQGGASSSTPVPALQTQSKSERLAGAEGMSLLRPLTNPPQQPAMDALGQEQFNLLDKPF